MVMETPDFYTAELEAYLRSIYRLDWEHGLHGWSHWVRVYENGMRLAKTNSADELVVGLFAFTHDIARKNDGGDRGHGARAAALIREEMQGRFFQLTPLQLAQLTQAVSEHTDGKTEADITVQTCWDSDRLDLWRAGYYPSPHKLCTNEAKDPGIIQWAVQRSEAWRQSRSSI